MNFKEALKTGISSVKGDSRVRELDEQLNELEQKEQNLMFQFGKDFYEQNKEKDLEKMDEKVKAYVNSINEVEEQREMLSKKKLFFQGLRKCDNCQEVIPADSLFCSKCGNKLNELLQEIGGNFCKNCGRELEEGAAFCTNCGTKVEEK